MHLKRRGTDLTALEFWNRRSDRDWEKDTRARTYVLKRGLIPDTLGSTSDQNKVFVTITSE